MNLRQFKALMMHPPLRNLILTGVLTCVVLGGVFFIQLSFDGFTILAWQIFVVDFACLLVLVGGSLGYVLSLYQQTLRRLSEARMQPEEDDELILHSHMRQRTCASIKEKREEGYSSCASLEEEQQQ